MANFISINHALDIIKNAGRAFELHFVRATGKKAGSIKTGVYTYGAPNPRAPKKSAPGAPERMEMKNKTHVINGTLPLTDQKTKALCTPLISHLIKIDAYRIKH